MSLCVMFVMYRVMSYVLLWLCVFVCGIVPVCFVYTVVCFICELLRVVVWCACFVSDVLVRLCFGYLCAMLVICCGFAFAP